jgi:hypothetical protein
LEDPSTQESKEEINKSRKFKNSEETSKESE